jgi:hypothetical protein
MANFAESFGFLVSMENPQNGNDEILIPVDANGKPSSS